MQIGKYVFEKVIGSNSNETLIYKIRDNIYVGFLGDVSVFKMCLYVDDKIKEEKILHGARFPTEQEIDELLKDLPKENKAIFDHVLLLSKANLKDLQELVNEHLRCGYSLVGNIQSLGAYNKEKYIFEKEYIATLLKRSN